MKLKKVKRKLIRFLGREDVRGTLESLLIIGILFFGVNGVMMLVLGTDSPTMAVISPSMKHDGEKWRDYYTSQGDNSYRFPIQGGFEPGDMLLLQGISSPGDVNVGDVIVYESEPLPISHRVAYVRIEGGKVWYVTKGDANPGLDNDIRLSPALGVEPDRVIGKVVLVVPKLGYVTLHPEIFVPLILLLFFTIMVIRRD